MIQLAEQLVLAHDGLFLVDFDNVPFALGLERVEFAVIVVVRGPDDVDLSKGAPTEHPALRQFAHVVRSGGTSISHAVRFVIAASSSLVARYEIPPVSEEEDEVVAAQREARDGGARGDAGGRARFGREQRLLAEEIVSAQRGHRSRFAVAPLLLLLLHRNAPLGDDIKHISLLALSYDGISLREGLFLHGQRHALQIPRR
mmetsp:Transcript_5091/g.9466  ORF Transcript_5091/g.9466 Transcript_5091/m.9466 type:complete len:201 (-) Transcript_5091:332-934(-)